MIEFTFSLSQRRQERLKKKSKKKTTSQMAHPKDPPKKGHVTSL
jgi:hypothetical protein